MNPRLAIHLALAIAALSLAESASAVLIPLSANVAANPAAAGTGLNGAYYNTNVTNNAAADAWFATQSPTGTFTAKSLNLSNGAGVSDGAYTIATYLGGNASNLVGNFTDTLDSALYHFTGYISIDSDMDLAPGGFIDMNFRVGSDDGMRLRIGNTTVVEYNAPRGFAYTAGSASFQSAGLYAIDLVYWENGGGTGLGVDWQNGNSGGWRTLPTAEMYGAVPVQITSAVPEPGGLALLGAGLLGFIGLRSRRRA